MRLFPYKEYTLYTSIPQNRVMQKMAESIKIIGADGQKSKNTCYKGEINENSFELKRDKMFYRSFNTLFSIYGECKEDDGITKIKFAVLYPDMQKNLIVILHISFAVFALFSLGDFSKGLAAAAAVVVLFIINLWIFHAEYKSYTKKAILFLEEIYIGESDKRFKIDETTEDSI